MTPSKPEGLPEGMVAWPGGDSAPTDWDGGPVLFRGGHIGEAESDSWLIGIGGPDAQPSVHDAIAYTPTKAATAEGQGEREAIAAIVYGCSPIYVTPRGGERRAWSFQEAKDQGAEAVIDRAYSAADAILAHRQAAQAELVEALAKRDAKYSVCPFLKRNPAPSKLACDVCGATSAEPCRKRVIADGEFVDDARATLAKHGAQP